jgi:hypothetical protein
MLADHNFLKQMDAQWHENAGLFQHQHPHTWRFLDGWERWNAAHGVRATSTASGSGPTGTEPGQHGSDSPPPAGLPPATPGADPPPPQPPTPSPGHESGPSLAAPEPSSLLLALLGGLGGVGLLRTQQNSIERSVGWIARLDTDVAAGAQAVLEPRQHPLSLGTRDTGRSTLGESFQARGS